MTTEAVGAEAGSELDATLRSYFRKKADVMTALANTASAVTYVVVPTAVWQATQDELESLRETLDILNDPETMANLAEASSEDPANRIGMDEAYALLEARKAREAGSA